MSVSGKKVFSELSVEQAGTRGNLLPGKPDIAAKPTLQVKTGAPDEMDQLTNAAANMVIDTSAEDEEAAKKERTIQRKELDKLFADSMLKDQVPAMKMPDALNIELFPDQQAVSKFVTTRTRMQFCERFHMDKDSLKFFLDTFVHANLSNDEAIAQETYIMMRFSEIADHADNGWLEDIVRTESDGLFVESSDFESEQLD
jgi:hypothetical protein